MVIIQDDMVIQESGWNLGMKPFEKFDDVFAVWPEPLYNYRRNPNSVHLGMKEDLDNCWCDIVQSCDEG